MARYSTTQGGTLRELTQFLALKKSVVNVKNEDNRCFGYSIIASRVSQTKTRNRNRPTEYDLFQNQVLDKIQYSVEDNQVLALEVTQKTNISIISFYGDEGTAPFPLSVSYKDYNQSADVLFWQGHFARITNFERFLYGMTRMKTKKCFCRKCLRHFMSEDALDRETSSAIARTSRTQSTLCLHLEKNNQVNERAIPTANDVRDLR